MSETDSTEQTTLGARTVPADYEGQLGDGERIPTVIESDGEEERCPYCGDWYSRISTHWSRGSCQWPLISQHKMKLLTGMMLGDGGMQTRNGYFECGMTNKTFLDWLSNELGWLVGDLSMQKTAVETAQNARETLGTETQPSDALDYYFIRSRTHPSLQQFTEWYSTGEIVFPTDIELTTMTLRMWYVSDGGFDWHYESPRIVFGSCNESERPEAIENMLEGAGFTVNHGEGSKSFCIPHREIEQFFDYMGHDPVPGFEYKWAYEDRDRYDRLKGEMREQHCTQTLK